MSLDKAIEEAAKAMWREQWAHSDEPPPENYEAVPIAKTYFEQMARAAYPVFREQLAQRLEAEARKRPPGSLVRIGLMDATTFLRESDR